MKKLFYILIFGATLQVSFSVLVAQEKSPAWQCQFSWNPLNFQCFPVAKPLTSSEKDIAQEELKLLEALQIKEKELKLKGEVVIKRETELRSLEQRIERKLDEIRSGAAKIEEERKKRETLDQQDLSQVVKFYESMESEKAAIFVNNMDRQTAANILKRMRPRKASALLELLDAQVAVEITENLSRIKLNREAATQN